MNDGHQNSSLQPPASSIGREESRYTLPNRESVDIVCFIAYIILLPKEEEEAWRGVALVPGEPRDKTPAYQPVPPKAHTLTIVLPPARWYRGGARQTRRAVQKEKN
jgi:hypothetical protein